MEILAPLNNGAMTFLDFVFKFLGGFDEALNVLLDFIVINLIIYLIYLLQSRSKNIIKLFGTAVVTKLIVIAVVGVSQSLDSLTGVDAIRQVSIYFFIAGEAKCILNFANMFGISVPEKILSTLDGFSKSTSKEDNEEASQKNEKVTEEKVTEVKATEKPTTEEKVTEKPATEEPVVDITPVNENQENKNVISTQENATT